MFHPTKLANLVGRILLSARLIYLSYARIMCTVLDGAAHFHRIVDKNESFNGKCGGTIVIMLQHYSQIELQA